MHNKDPLDCAIDALVCAALCGEKTDWPWPRGVGEYEARVLQFATRHGVAALSHASAATSHWPPSVRQALRHSALALAQWELRHEELLRQLLPAMRARGIQPLLIKGTALAYCLYPHSALRQRGDTDLLVASRDKAPASQCLVALGFEPHLAVDGEFVSYQASHTHTSADGSQHTVDLHWKVNNSPILARTASHEELMATSIALPMLSADARAPSLVHSLAIACTHRASHVHNPYYVDGVPQHDPNRLIWLYDIHLLAQAFTADDWQALDAWLRDKRIVTICDDALAAAQRAFGTPVPPERAVASRRPNERSWAYVNAGKTQQAWMDVRALESHRARLKWLRETLFPSRSYMRRRYANQSIGLLPWLYLRRAWHGLRKRSAVEPPSRSCR